MVLTEGLYKASVVTERELRDSIGSYWSVPSSALRLHYVMLCYVIVPRAVLVNKILRRVYLTKILLE